MNYSKIIVLFLTVFCLSSVWGQDKIWFTPNEGQWEAPIKFKTKLVSGEMILEQAGFTYHFHNGSDLYHHEHEGESHKDHEFKGQVIRTKFLGGNVPIIESSIFSNHYNNYFLGNDSSKWKSEIHDVNKISYHEIYEGISMDLYQVGDHLKYDFVIAPHKNPSIIQVEYSGMNRISVDKEGDLIVRSDFGDIIESAPVAYQLIDGEKKEVRCKFVLNNDVMSFDLGKYDESIQLIIDPDLIFSSFTGATADNWGMTATPDTLGNLYAGGIVFSAGYPFITGSYDATFNGGQIDMGISKFNETGTNLLFSTFIGGGRVETPHSLVVNEEDELYIFGTTSSFDFPATAGAYDETYNPSGSITSIGNSITYDGSDLVVVKMSNTGASLLAATYVGGSGIDGISNQTPLRYNYGDDVRGEIIIDGNSDVYVATTTRSNDFPIVGGFDASLGGTQDGVLFKLNSNLTTLLSSTYIGGSDLDASYAVQLDQNGDVLVAGGTVSTDFPGVTGGLNATYQGGLVDGYICKVSGVDFSLLQSTYIGTSSYDQTYFIQLDLDDDVYVYGQSENGYPVSGAVYNNPNSGQFIHKLSNDLTTSIWSTSIGAGSNDIEISPTAFLVSDCYDIYISGWGGITNSSNSLATSSSSNGFPVTPDAYQPSTNGNNFYLAVLDRDAQFLKYGTYFGGVSSSNNHVDGGTSRFDKKGSVYHAVCASCGPTNNGFTSTPGVWSETSNSANCNLAAFKFDLGIVKSSISVPEPFICIPDPIEFTNESENGNAFIWDFGDGNTSTEFSPSHLYADTGTYTVTLITIDTLQCYTTDTSEVEIVVDIFSGAVVVPVETFCPGTPVQFQASGGVEYDWFPAQFLNDASIANPIATVFETTEFSVVVSDTCGTDTLSFILNIFDVTGDATGDTIICLGDSVQIQTVDGSDYIWQPEDMCNDHTVQNPIVFPETTTNFTVELLTLDGCVWNDSVLVEVELDVPQPIVPDILSICEGTSEQVVVGGGDTYLWSPVYEISNINIPDPIISTTVDTSYVIAFGNVCGVVYDTLDVEVIEIQATAWNDTIVCPGEIAVVYASGGTSFQWFNGSGISNPNDSISYVSPDYPTYYGVQVTDQFGCHDTAYVFVDLFPQPFVIASPDYYGFIGDTIPMSAEGNGNGSYVWSPNEFLTCDTCQSTTSFVNESFGYTVYYTDENGCTTNDHLEIYFEGLLYVPNAFTPNGDGFNDMFNAEGGNINEFYLAIFNRWGELIYESEDFESGWDGTYKGLPSPDGVYVWKIIYSDFELNTKQLHGHVVLLR